MSNPSWGDIFADQLAGDIIVDQQQPSEQPLDLYAPKNPTTQDESGYHRPQRALALYDDHSRPTGDSSNRPTSKDRDDVSAFGNRY